MKSPTRAPIAVEVVHDDIRHAVADVVALQFARARHGADAAVAQALGLSEGATFAPLMRVGAGLGVDGVDALAARQPEMLAWARRAARESERGA